ncbi:DUF3397 domain-containing protein [Sporosarcina sp. ACRSM]|uniref:DUF3397 family protein n=1 Tax=Sporosarcina sp. ACRSM TaxID=2918216 RepID=UPI001EF4F1A0|nr:DUF3397 family protein [Sporosarcina sp. ACRSM]MCG7334155.1 DUF3397 domain-containing protein [Sporosarcina sp. ACRSM]
MAGLIASIWGILILFPFIVTIVFLVVARKMGKAPAGVIGLAADVTTPFLFIAVYIISMTTFGKGIGIYIAGLAIVIAIVHVVIERLKVKEFRIIRLLRRTWRFYFLLLLIAYFLLLLTGSVLKIIEYMT